MADDAKLFQSEPEPQRNADSSSPLKPGERPDDSLNISRGAIRAPSPDPSLLSVDHTVRLGRSASHVSGYRHASRSPVPPRSLRGRVQQSWVKNKGLALVLIAQLFGTLMNVTTRILEMEGNDGKHSAGMKCDVTCANDFSRQRLSSFPHSVCENEHNCPMFITVHVV